MTARATLIPSLALILVAGLGSAPAPTPPSAVLLDDATPPGFVDRAEMSSFFCFFVFIDAGGDASGYSGESRAVTTPSGNTNYKCDADLLFGPGVSRGQVFHDVTFFSFDLGPLEPCTVRFTPGDNAFANCAVRPD